MVKSEQTRICVVDKKEMFGFMQRTHYTLVIPSTTCTSLRQFYRHLLQSIITVIITFLKYFQCNIACSRWGYRRFTEVMVITLITAACQVFIPIAFSCTSSDHLVDHIPGFDSISDCARYIDITNITSVVPDGYVTPSLSIYNRM